MCGSSTVVWEGNSLAGEGEGGGEDLRQALRQVRANALCQQLVRVQARQAPGIAVCSQQQGQVNTMHRQSRDFQVACPRPPLLHQVRLDSIHQQLMQQQDLASTRIWQAPCQARVASIDWPAMPCLPPPSPLPPVCTILERADRAYGIPCSHVPKPHNLNVHS